MIRLAWALLSSEAGKLRCTALIPIAVGAPVVVAFFDLMLWLGQNRRYPMQPETIWNLLRHGGGVFWVLPILPLLIAVQAAMLVDMEHSGQHWKQLFAWPIPRWSVYAAKMTAVAAVVGVSFAVFVPMFVLAALGFGAVRHLPVEGTIPWRGLSGDAIRSFVAAWPLIAIQTWISVRFRGLAAAVGISIAALLCCAIFSGPLEQAGHWYPWLLPLWALAEGYREPHSLVAPAIAGAAGGIALAAFACVALSSRPQVSG